MKALFKLLLKHLIKEKIEYATVLNLSKLQDNKARFANAKKDVEKIRPEKINVNGNTENTANTNKKDKVEIKGAINGETEKALLLNFETGQELWVPKSTIHSQFDNARGENQSFLIDNWILKKNKIIS